MTSQVLGLVLAGHGLALGLGLVGHVLDSITGKDDMGYRHIAQR